MLNLLELQINIRNFSKDIDCVEIIHEKMLHAQTFSVFL